MIIIYVYYATQSLRYGDHQKFLSFSPGDDLLEFHQAVVSTLRDSDDACAPEPAPLPPNIQHNPLLTHTNEDMARLCDTHGDLDTNPAEDEANDTGKSLQILKCPPTLLSLPVQSWSD